MEEKLLGQKIIEAIELGKQMFGSAAGLARQYGGGPREEVYISRWAKGDISPQVAKVEKLLAAVGAELVLPAETIRDYTRLVQLYDTDEASAAILGKMSEIEPESVAQYVLARKHAKPNLLFHPDFLKKLDVDARYAFLFEVHNDGMSPTLNTGDQVLADARSFLPDFTPSMYVISMNGGFWVRWLQKVGSEIILSDERTQRQMRLSPEQQQELRILGKIVWIGKKV